jgi:Outer membrane protein beta-barrel domain
MRRSLTHALIVASMSLSLPALAQDAKPNCPPGAWFCAEAQVQVSTTPAPPAPPAPPPVVVEEDLPPPPPVRVHPRRYEAPPPPPARPPIVVYQPVPATSTRVIIITPGYSRRVYTEPPPAYVAPSYLPPPPQAYRLHQAPTRWGLNARVEAAMLGNDGNHEGQERSATRPGMGGAGVSLRYRPVPAFAFDAGIDFLGGTDYNGFARTETPLSLGGLVFLNPRSHVQFYLMGGINFSRATVRSETASPLLTRNADGDFGAQYSHFGGQAGAGLEFRLGRHLGIDAALLGFIRHRTDTGDLPEFVDPATGKTTKNSGGGLFRGGLSFWW